MRRGILALFAVACAIAPVHAQSGGSNWIWADDGESIKDFPAGERFFRKTFPVQRYADEATLDITADDAFTVWINGTKVGSGDTWKTVYHFDVKKHLMDGKNVLTIAAENKAKGSAGLLVRFSYVPNGQARQNVTGDATWKASAKAAEGWREVAFDDSKWAAPRILGQYGKTGPWKGQSWQSGGDDRFSVPAGFRVEFVAANPKPGDPFSLVNMCFDAKGRLLVSQERGPILLVTNANSEGVFQSIKPYCVQLKNCQGMCWIKDALWLVGDGPEGTGMYRCRDTKGADATDEVKLMHKFKGAMGEHGPHAIIHGPDDMVYFIAGNHAWAKPEKLAANSPLTRWPDGQMGPDQGKPNATEDVLLPRLNDARGHAANILAPGGTIWRMDQDGGNVALVAAGFRNHFDAAFNPGGELFTYDSDMEWDENLPWYRPVRAVHVPPGGDFLWRTGAANTPSHYIDSLPPLAETGRGSPVGVECYDHVAFPAKYRGAVFLADWSIGAIWVVHPEKSGATYKAKAEKFCTGSPMNVTDLAVGPDGAIYFTMGGRNTQGGICRIVAEGSKPAPADAIVQPLAAWSKGRANPTPKLDSAALYAALESKDAAVRAHAVWHLGVHGDAKARELLVNALKDEDALVRRRACEAFIRQNIEAPAPMLLPLLAENDRFVRTAARLVLQRIDAKKWAVPILAEENDTLAEEAIVALCKTNQAGAYGEAIFDRLHQHTPDADATALLNHLRTLQLALMHAKERPGSLRGIAVDLLAMFPHADARVNRELAILLTELRREKVLGEPVHEKILAAMLGSTDREQQIHYFYCLRLLHDGWTASQKMDVLKWYDGSRAWKGGASFTPFLENILRDLGPAFTAADREAALAKAEELPASVAVLLRTATAEQLPSPKALADLFARVKSSKKGDDLPAAVLSALSRSDSAEAAAALRRIADEDPSRTDLVAQALARMPRPENWPYLVRALESPNPLIVFDAVEALRRIPTKPKIDDPKPFRAALLAGRKLDAGSRVKAILLLRHWTNGREFGYEKGQVQEELAAWATWYGQTFPMGPKLPNAPGVAGSGGKHKFEELSAYLDKNPDGKGDAKRGKEVFAKANCLKCHKYGTEGEGVGPDLTTLSKRFKRIDTLEAILQPSKVISDQFRSTTIMTKKGQRIDGLAAPNGDVVVVLLNDGSKVTLKESEIESRYVSLVSVMPENLLDALTKVDIADLFAYLESEPAK